MWPDFSYILHSLIGTEPDNAFSIIKTFGFFLGIAFIASASLLYLELKRKEEQKLIFGKTETIVIYKPLDWQELLIQAFINFIIFYKLGYIFRHFGQFKIDPAAIIFSLKGNFISGCAAFILTAAYLYYKMSNEKDKTIKTAEQFIHPYQRITNITIVAAAYGLIGSKLFSVLENWSSFIKDPLGEFFSGSGLTIYGGLILAFIMVYRYVSKRGIQPIHMMDAVAPSLMIGYCIGRMGCHFSGDGDWGIVNELSKPSWFIFPDSWWANSYAHNVLNEGVSIPTCQWRYCNELYPKVFPTPLYEIILAGIITIILWLLRTKLHRAGLLFFIYCFLNGLERFFIEFIRVNPRYHLAGFDLSMAQVIAVGLIVTGIGGFFFYWKKNIPA
ncbi:MAG: prolipoprotein diacylglyceryl transferase [Saprospiraceae bacterium]|nr:prolipoprotein diacylglyceryl transferase [Saprospiraceae bacterium]HRG68750.1 prolipoprotein diacylglyceryl transferase [Saprospiraceae bacterium]